LIFLHFPNVPTIGAKEVCKQVMWD